MTGLYLGVDAGNSKTDALLCDSGGRVVGRGRSGNGDIYGAASPADAVEAVLTAVGDALRDASSTVADVAGAAFRLAGVDWPEDEKFWATQIADHLPDLTRFSVANDGFAPIRCGEPSGIGVAIVAGTGPAVAGRGPSGKEWSINFWVQEALGASGLGHDGLRAVFHAAIGLGPQTAMTDRMAAHFGLDDVENLLHRLTARDQPVVSRATVAPIVTRIAADGDPVAQGIVRQQAERLADYGRVVAERVGFAVAVDPVPVVLAGSVLAGQPSVMADALVTSLARRLPAARPRVVTLPPVAGATLDALAEAGVPVPALIMDVD